MSKRSLFPLAIIIVPVLQSDGLITRSFRP
jgi:hypothetical protein